MLVFLGHVYDFWQIRLLAKKNTKGTDPESYLLNDWTFHRVFFRSLPCKSAML